jgi:predicted nucleic acid-binding protein
VQFYNQAKIKNRLKYDIRYLFCINRGSHKYIINLPNYFEIIKITQNDKLYQLKMLLDDGESEAILLAKQMKLPLIIDEEKG